MSDYQSNEIITAQQVREAISTALPEAGQDVLIHASLGRLGHFESGIEDLISVIREAAAPDGTVIMMTDTRSFARTGRFSLDQPSETGLLTERFRQSEGVRRSVVPMVSYCAAGPSAEFYTQPYDSHLDETSTIKRLLDRDGMIMLMGVSYEKCTLFHLAEERHGTPYNFYKEFDGVLVEGDRPVGPISQRYYVRRDMSVRKDPAVAGAMLEDRGLATITPLGRGLVRTFRARDFDACCMEALDANPNAFLISGREAAG